MSKNPIIFFKEKKDYEHKDPNTEEYYKWQCDILANSILLGDNAHTTQILKATVPVTDKVMNKYWEVFNFKWLNKGEVLAGSFVMFVQSPNSPEPQDVDIYFKQKEDCFEFAKLNNLIFGLTTKKTQENTMCLYYTSKTGISVNLIFGVEYADASDLISKFDIRACSMAITKFGVNMFGNQEVEITNVAGSFYDTSKKELVFNPSPRGVSLARLIKYVNKGFSVPTYQRLFFAELIRSEKYNVDVEKFTKY